VILIADDEPELRGVLETLLADAGYSVITAGDGVDAMAQILAHQPDLLIVGMVMRRLGAIDLCRAYREQGGTSPVILLTATQEDVLMGVAVECDADGYTVKPVWPQAMLETVARCLRRAGTLSR
jgi:DNA-binding response OmpR family regulator